MAGMGRPSKANGTVKAATPRAARQEPRLPTCTATTHSFRKTVATLNDDEGLSARIGADHLGHSHVSMTQDRYMSRGRIHTQVADLLDRAVSERDEPRSE
jgi:integrase